MTAATLLDHPEIEDISGRIGSGPKPDVGSIRRGLTIHQGLVDWRAAVQSISKHPTPEERFWSRVDKSGACWEWHGSLTYQGYGQFSCLHNKTVRAHRYAYELLVGPIPTGLVLDHVCRNRKCVNPAHLEAVTNAENIKRGIGPTAVNERKIRCARGHEYTPENTYITVEGYRRCRECDAAWARRNRRAEYGVTRECGAPARRGPCTRRITNLAPCPYHNNRTENANA